MRWALSGVSREAAGAGGLGRGECCAGDDPRRGTRELNRDAIEPRRQGEVMRSPRRKKEQRRSYFWSISIRKKISEFLAVEHSVLGGQPPMKCNPILGPRLKILHFRQFGITDELI